MSLREGGSKDVNHKCHVSYPALLLIPHLVDQGNLARVIQDVMQIIPIQSFHNDNVVMWLLGYLKRSLNLNGVTFSIVF